MSERYLDFEASSWVSCFNCGYVFDSDEAYINDATEMECPLCESTACDYVANESAY